MHQGKIRDSKFFKWLSVVLVITMMIAGFPVATAVPAQAIGVATITPASGGTGISIDTTSGGGTGAWTALGSITGPTITETAVGQISVGVHILSLAAGWEFNQSQNVTIGVGAVGGVATKLALAASVVTPGVTTIAFQVMVPSSDDADPNLANPSALNFSNIQVRPTGTTVNSVNMTHSGAAIAGVTNGTTNFGTVGSVGGAVSQITFQTQPSTTATSGTAFAQQPIVVSQDQFGNTRTGDTNTITLSAFTNAGCTLAATGNLTGTLNKAEVAGIASFAANAVKYDKMETIYLKASDGTREAHSGAIAVDHAAAAAMTIFTAPVIGASVDVILGTQPVIKVVDAADNPVDGATVTASIAPGTGSGTLRTTLTAVTVANGKATFADLGYNKIDAFTLRFSTGGLHVDSASLGPITQGAATKVRVETAANGSGTVVIAQSLVSGSNIVAYSITRDQYDNFIANAAADSWSLTGKTGGAADGNLVAAEDKKAPH